MTARRKGSSSLRVCFFGTPNVAVPYLQALLDAGHEVCAVVSQPDRPAGRGRDVRPTPVKELALDSHLTVLQPETCGCPEFAEALAGNRPEVGVAVAYGQLIPPNILDCPQHGCLNVHYSLLPALRGGAPVQHALLRGLCETGVTVQTMAPELDAGDILLQERVPILPEDNSLDLFERLNESGPPGLLRALELVASGEARPTPQDESGVSWAPELSKEDCRIDWTRSAESIRNQVRACAPRPGAFAFRGKRRLKVLAAEVVEGPLPEGGGGPGAIAEHAGADSPVVMAGDGALALRTVQPEGKRAMSGEEWARGARLEPGEMLT